MLRRALALPLLLVVVSCGPALRPLPPMSPLPAPPSESPAPVPQPAEASVAVAPERDAALDALRERGLMVPVRGVLASRIPDSFNSPRDGERVHHAEDILAKRGTPVVAADDGTVLHVGTNTLGGKVIWTTDPSRQFAFYYAHLQRYAKGLRDGQQISRGEVIGFVGTTGNAPKNVPHLHFQLLRIVKGTRYSNGPALDPLPFFTSLQAAR